MPGTELRVYARARVAAMATAWSRGRCEGSYVVENLSLGGALLSGGPAMRPGATVRLFLELPRGAVEVGCTVLRSAASGPRTAVLAVGFDGARRQAREAIGRAIAEALEEASRDAASRPEPTVLVVDSSILGGQALARDVRRAGWEATCLPTPLDALAFLGRPESRVQAALVDHEGTRDGLDLLGHLADERPSVRRVLVAGDGTAAPLARAHAVLRRPWDREALARAIAPAGPAA